MNNLKLDTPSSIIAYISGNRSSGKSVQIR